MTALAGSVPDATPENLARMPWLYPHFVTPEGEMLSHIQMFIIETPSQKLVVDTCIGNNKNLTIDELANMQGPFIDNLKEMGHEPDSVDTVILTHLHVDHIGWNTTKRNGSWVPTFPNARYLTVEEEYKFFSELEEDIYGDVWAESVQPVLDAGLLDVVKSDHHADEGVWFESTPGHTPGHVSVRISSQGEDAVITGDMIHHPYAIGRPDWWNPYDADIDVAGETRNQFLERYADKPVLVLGTHFNDPVGGKIVRDGDTYRFDV
ncbi:MAG: MBL fold metallo-hydrolase [Gammaproteobacteria bacterium]|nr:MBL fold metallo-hydrolase [Gammaproteobacteria bacterium]